MKTKTKKPHLVAGALYRVETVEATTAAHSTWETLRWTKRGWRDRRGRKSLGSCNGRIQRVRFSDATAEWQVVLLREYDQKLEQAGGRMATWFPNSSSHRKRLIAEWFEARRAKP